VRTRLLLVLLGFACNGNTAVVDAGIDAAPPQDVAVDSPVTKPDAGVVCHDGTTLLSTNVMLDRLGIANGFVYARVNANAYTPIGVMRCATTGGCTAATSILEDAGASVFQDYAVGGSLYTTFLDDAGGGSVHAAMLDGTNDQILVADASFPSWVTTSGSNVFWVSDAITAGGTSPSVVYCAGCDAGSAWLSEPAATYAVFADDRSVYLLADDGTKTTEGIYGCSLDGGCIEGGARTLITGLVTDLPDQVASDGTYVYVARNDHSTIVRIDTTNTATNFVTNVVALAIAIDPASGTLFYGSVEGGIYSMPTDGSKPATELATCSNATINSIVFDATNVYALVDGTNTNLIYAAPR